MIQLEIMWTGWLMKVDAMEQVKWEVEVSMFATNIR